MHTGRSALVGPGYVARMERVIARLHLHQKERLVSVPESFISHAQRLGTRHSLTQLSSS